MAVYKPTYTDKKTGEAKESATWWYEFVFNGHRVRESSKSTRKTVALEAEKNRRLEMEKGFNGLEDRRHTRILPVKGVADKFLSDYRERNPRSATFAEYALGHVKRILGSIMVVEITDTTVKEYQTARLKEKASPKSINEEVGFLLRVLEEQGDAIRSKMRRLKTLKLSVRNQIAKAFTDTEAAALLDEARKRRSPSIYPALMLALNAGMRDAEIRGLQWARLDLCADILRVGESKTAAGQGRAIPLNPDLKAALVEHSKWYLEKFGETRPEWFVFPFGKPQPTDPTKPATSFKTVWAKVRAAAGVEGRWHDNRHTFITDLAESPNVSDETIRQLAGHVSKQMLEHYSHIRMDAKRKAVESLVRKPSKGKTIENSNEALQEVPKVAVLN